MIRKVFHTLEAWIFCHKEAKEPLQEVPTSDPSRQPSFPSSFTLTYQSAYIQRAIWILVMGVLGFLVFKECCQAGNCPPTWMLWIPPICVGFSLFSISKYYTRKVSVTTDTIEARASWAQTPKQIFWNHIVSVRTEAGFGIDLKDNKNRKICVEWELKNMPWVANAILKNTPPEALSGAALNTLETIRKIPPEEWLYLEREGIASTLKRHKA